MSRWQSSPNLFFKKTAVGPIQQMLHTERSPKDYTISKTIGFNQQPNITPLIPNVDIANFNAQPLKLVYPNSGTVMTPTPNSPAKYDRHKAPNMAQANVFGT